MSWIPWVWISAQDCSYQTGTCSAWARTAAAAARTFTSKLPWRAVNFSFLYRERSEGCVVSNTNTKWLWISCFCWQAWFSVWTLLLLATVKTGKILQPPPFTDLSRWCYCHTGNKFLISWMHGKTGPWQFFSGSACHYQQCCRGQDGGWGPWKHKENKSPE